MSQEGCALFTAHRRQSSAVEPVLFGPMEALAQWVRGRNYQLLKVKWDHSLTHIPPEGGAHAALKLC